MLAAKQILLISLIFYCCLVFYMYLQQKSFIFFPTRTHHSPNDTSIREFTTQNSGTQLHGWLINPDFCTQKLIIYYGGNAEDIFLSIDEYRSYSDTATLLVSYRGYGKSEGYPGEKELYSDALAVFDTVSHMYSPSKIFLMGRSLGSGVATYVASRRSVSGVILVTPYDSILSIAKNQFPYLPVSFLLQHKFLSSASASKITAPCLILYGGRDRTIPPSNTAKLISAISAEKSVVYIEQAEHNNIELFDEYTLAILQFLQEY